MLEILEKQLLLKKKKDQRSSWLGERDCICLKEATLYFLDVP